MPGRSGLFPEIGDVQFQYQGRVQPIYDAEQAAIDW